MTRLALPFLLTCLLFLGFSQVKNGLFPETRKQFEAANNIFYQAELLSEKAEKDQQLNQLADNKYREALVAYNNILKNSRSLLTDSLEFIIRIRKGYIEYYFDSLNASKNDYLASFILKEKVPAIPDSLLFSPLLFTGGIYYTQNQYDSALYYYKAAEAINENSGNSLSSSQRLYNRLGVMHYETGNYKQAKNYFEKAIAELLKQPGAEKSLLDNYKMNIGALLVKLEDFDKAKEIYESLLPTEDYANEIYHNLGIISLKKEDYRSGLEHLRKVNYGQSKKTTDLYYDYYWAWSGLGNTDSAEVYLHESLAANLKWNGHRKNTTYGLILKLQGDEELKKNKYNAALSHYQQAIIQFCTDFNETDINKNPAQFSSSFSYINLFSALTAKAEALYSQSRIEKNRELADAALHAYEAAFSLADYVNRNYTSDESRLFLGNIKHSVHSKPIDICLALYEQNKKKDYLEKAWLFDQQNKASILALNIQETEWRNNNEQGELLKKESSLKNKITRLSIKAAGTSDTATTAQLAAQIRDLEIELENVNDELNNDPRWLQRKSADIIPAINQLQKKLDNTTALISYHLSEDGLLSFLITGTKFNYFRTPLNNVFYNDIESFQHSLHNVDQEKNYDGTIYAMNLYQVLIRPLKHGLNNIKRLIIIPDDELNYLPFEALQNEERRYLTEQFAITYQYSAALFDQRKNTSYARGTLGFAPFTDEGYTDENGKVYSKLPTSQNELSGVKGLTFTSTSAKKDSFLSKANHFRIIHLATHASLNNEEPYRSFILFNPSEKDNKLYSNEIHNLDLDSTQLVILSACETGTGKLVKGEGLMSLSRAFAYAGCPNIITSLWKASDKTTAFLTNRVHYYLDKGFSRDMALQQARIDLLANNEIEPRYKTPSYWSHLILIGNYEPFHKNNNWWWIAIVLIAGAFIYKAVKNKSLSVTRKA